MKASSVLVPLLRDYRRITGSRTGRRCGNILPGITAVERLAEGGVQFSGLSSCGNCLCPRCSATRNLKVKLLLKHGQTSGAWATGITTASHDYRTSLREQLSDLSRHAARLSEGRGEHVLGDRWVRVWEVTHGRNGFHAHCHWLWQPRVFDSAFEQWCELQEEWRTVVAASARRWDERANRMQWVRGNIAAYMAKDTLALGSWAAEGSKASVSMLQLMRKAAAGDQHSFQRFRQAEKAMRSARMRAYSRVFASDRVRAAAATELELRAPQVSERWLATMSPAVQAQWIGGTPVELLRAVPPALHKDFATGNVFWS